MSERTSPERHANCLAQEFKKISIAAASSAIQSRNREAAANAQLAAQQARMVALGQSIRSVMGPLVAEAQLSFAAELTLDVIATPEQVAVELLAARFVVTPGTGTTFKLVRTSHAEPLLQRRLAALTAQSAGGPEAAQIREKLHREQKTELHISSETEMQQTLLRLASSVLIDAFRDSEHARLASMTREQLEDELAALQEEAPSK